MPVDQSTAGSIRRLLIFAVIALVCLTLVLAARVGVAIYEQAHPRDVEVHCDAVSNDNAGDDGYWYDRSYTGPADVVLGACAVGR